MSGKKKAAGKAGSAGNIIPALQAPANSNTQNFNKMKQRIIVGPMVQASSAAAGSSGTASNLSNLQILNKGSRAFVFSLRFCKVL